MLNINKPIILATSQVVSCTSFSMSKTPQGKWTANINFSISDENGAPIDTKSINVAEDAWNNFWTNFTSGTFLYQQYSPDATAQEGDFTN
jgi:hypothetical protein